MIAIVTHDGWGLALMPDATRVYHYLGDKLTREDLVGQRCEAVLNERGKCCCSRLGTMLVRFEGDVYAVVLRRRLRKVST